MYTSALMFLNVSILRFWLIIGHLSGWLMVFCPNIWNVVGTYKGRLLLIDGVGIVVVGGGHLSTI